MALLLSYISDGIAAILHFFYIALPPIWGGGAFSQSLVVQAFSDVIVIIDEVLNLQRGQFANSRSVKISC